VINELKVQRCIAFCSFRSSAPLFASTSTSSVSFLKKKKLKPGLRRRRRADGPGDDPELAVAQPEPADLAARGGEGGGEEERG